jgi:hypothetical protein
MDLIMNYFFYIYERIIYKKEYKLIMVYILLSLLVILFFFLIRFLQKDNSSKGSNVLNLKKINKEIFAIYKRKASVSEMKNILLVIQKYKEKYRMYPHENDLKRIIIKYREY